MADTSKIAVSMPSWGLVLVRIVCGAILVQVGWMKVSGTVSEELVTGTKAAFEQAPGFVRTWGENVVLPHAWLFAHMIAWGEFLGGLALFLGVLTRPAGLAVAFMFANFYFAGPEDARFFVMLLAACGLGCALSHAGRRVGVDGFLAGRLPGWVT